MQGKILGADVIRGKDDKRYAFDSNELQNTQGKDINELIGSEVDFEVVNEKAVSIYITEFKSILSNSSSLNSQTSSTLHATQNFAQKTFAKAEPLSPQMQEIKNKAFGAMALKVLGAFILAFSNVFGDFDLGLALYFIGLGVAFVGFLVLCATINLVQRYSNSETLLKNLIIAEIIGFVVGVMLFLSKIQWLHAQSQETKVAFAIVYVIALIALVFYNYRYFKELALTTKQPLFLYAFWCGVTLILSPVALVLYVVAWAKFREVVEVEKDDKNSSTKDFDFYEVEKVVVVIMPIILFILVCILIIF